MKNNLLKIFICLVIVMGLGWAGYQKFNAGTKTAPNAADAKGQGGPVPVGVAVVGTKDLAIMIDTVGTLSASESAEIRAEMAGAVKSVNFSEGGSVKKGDSLVEIDDSLIRAELMKSEATYSVRKTTFDRSDKLKSSGYVSNQDWEQTKSSLQESKADIESARIRLDKTKVRAPFNGTAGLRNFSVGDYIQVGQVLTTVDATDPIKITFSVPEKNYSDLKVSQQISFSVDAWPQEKFIGEIYAVSPRVDQDTRNFDVKATIPNKEGKLRPGMFARISILVAEHKGAMIIPEQAVIPKGTDSFVYVVRDGKAVLQKIDVGTRQPGTIEVLSGLSPQEQVVITGLMTLRDGTDVKVAGP